MKLPQDPNNPNEWFNLARELVNDEAVFSYDQIGLLNGMIEMLANGIITAVTEHKH